MKHQKSEIFEPHKSERFMKCHTCGKTMEFVQGMKFNDYSIDGWKCSCGEIYYEPEQAQKILLLNKLKKEVIRAKLGRIRSNLILRLPRDVESALNLQKGEEVIIQVEGKGLKIIPS